MPETETDYRAMAHAAGGAGNEHIVDAAARALHYNESIHAHNIHDGGYEIPYAEFKTCRYCLLRAARVVSALAGMGALIVHDAPEPEPGGVAGEVCFCRHFVRSHRAHGCLYCSCTKTIHPKAAHPITVENPHAWVVWDTDGSSIALMTVQDGIALMTVQDGETDPWKALGIGDPRDPDLILDELDRQDYQAFQAFNDQSHALRRPGGRDLFYTVVVPG